MLTSKRLLCVRKTTEYFSDSVIFKELRAMASFACLLSLILSFKHPHQCKDGDALCYFSFHLAMNPVSRRARFTEPTRENKDVLIRNIRRERAIAFVNGSDCGWAPHLCSAALVKRNIICTHDDMMVLGVANCSKILLEYLKLLEGMPKRYFKKKSF